MAQMKIARGFQQCTWPYCKKTQPSAIVRREQHYYQFIAFDAQHRDYYKFKNIITYSTLNIIKYNILQFPVSASELIARSAYARSLSLLCNFLIQCFRRDCDPLLRPLRHRYRNLIGISHARSIFPKLLTGGGAQHHITYSSHKYPQYIVIHCSSSSLILRPSCHYFVIHL